MVKQRRPDEVVSILEADFQSRYEHGFAWSTICAAFQDLPGLRAFWSTGTVNQYGDLADESGQGNILENNTAGASLALVNTRPLPPYVEFTGDEYFIADDATGGGITGSGTTNTIPLWTSPNTLGDSIMTEAGAVINILHATSPQLRINDTTDSSSYLDLIDVSATQAKIEKIASAGNAAQIDMNPEPADGTSEALVRLFRETNTSGAVRFRVYKGDNTATVQDEFLGNSHTHLNANAGSVGIGLPIATAPSQELHIRGTDNIFAQIEATGANSIAGVIFDNDATTWNVTVDGTTSDWLRLRQGGTNHAFFTTTTNLLLNGSTDVTNGGGVLACGDTGAAPTAPGGGRDIFW